MHEQFATASIEHPHLFVDLPDKAELVAAEIVTRLAAGNLTHSA